MLQRIRDNSSGPIAYVIVGLITLVFGVWGIGSYFTPSANPVVASVGNVDITRYQLQQAYDQRYRQLRVLMGDRFDPEMIQPDKLRRSILQRLVRTAVLDQYAIDAGYRTTDAALLQALTSNPRFQTNGKFSTDRYRTLLASAGLEPAVYEARLRRDLVSAQLRAGLVGSAFVAPPAVEYAYGLRNQKRDLAYLVFAASAYADQVEVTAEDVKTWYESHADQYMRPERVKLAYVELDRSALGAEQAATEDALRDLYEQNKARFGTPELRDGRQVFVPVAADNASQARQKIQSIAEQIAQGEKTFDEVATATDGGVKVTQLDDVSRNDVPADIADALFGLDVGEVSSPVRGAKGWYLLKVSAVQPGETQPFSAPEVQKQLKKMARAQWRSQQFGDLAERMETLAFQAPNSLDTIASELGLEVQQTGWITRAEGQQLGQYQSVRQAAFSDAVLNEGLNSTAIQIGTDRRVVLRIADHQAPQQIPLDEVRDRIKQQLVKNKAQQRALEAAQAAQDKLAEGASLESIAADGAAQFKQPGYVGRSNSDIPGAIREALFALPEPKEGAAEYQALRTADGNAALVALQGVKTGAGAGAAGQGVDPAFVQSQRAYVAQLEFQAFADYLNAHADVELNREQLDIQ